jgi:hypothetical protein
MRRSRHSLSAWPWRARLEREFVILRLQFARNADRTGRRPESRECRWLVGPATMNLWRMDGPTNHRRSRWLVRPRTTYGGWPDRPTINGLRGRLRQRFLARAGRAGRGGRRLLASAHGVGYLVGVGGGNRPGPRGDSGHAVSPTGSTSGRGEPDASPMTRSPPLGPGCMTGTKRQCRVGHGPHVGRPRISPRRAGRKPLLDSSSRAVRGRARR